MKWNFTVPTSFQVIAADSADTIKNGFDCRVYIRYAVPTYKAVFY